VASTWARYRILWWSTLLAIAVPAVLLGCFESPIPAVLSAATLLGLRMGVSAAEVGPAWRPWVPTLLGVALPAAGAPVLGELTLPLIFLATATSVRVLQVLRVADPEGRTGRVEPVSLDGADLESCLSTMSGAELCELWGRSFALLRSKGDASRRVVGAGLRGSILDELERRDSRLLAAWLARHPSAASPPTWVTIEEPPDQP
jgi:hypothetical protein